MLFLHSGWKEKADHADLFRTGDRFIVRFYGMKKEALSSLL